MHQKDLQSRFAAGHPAPRRIFAVDTGPRLNYDTRIGAGSSVRVGSQGPSGRQLTSGRDGSCGSGRLLAPLTEDYAMTRIIAALVAAGLLSTLAGCATLVRDKEQQIEQYGRIAEVNRRVLSEDVNSILLLDRPTRLTKWVVRETY